MTAVGETLSNKTITIISAGYQDRCEPIHRDPAINVMPSISCFVFVQVMDIGEFEKVEIQRLTYS